MIRSTLVFYMMAFLMCCACSCSGGEQGDIPIQEFKELPRDFQFFSTGVRSQMPSFVTECDSWPDERAIKEKRVDVSDNKEVKAPLRSSVRWLKKILHPSLVPDDVDKKLLPLKGSLAGNDAFWMRYAVNGYSVQVVTDFGRVRLLVSPLDSADPMPQMDKENMQTLVAEMIPHLFKKAESVEEKLPMVQEKDGVFSGIPKGGRGRASNLWWQQVRWWSDGRSVAFWIPKTDQGTAMKQPTRRKHWFTKPPDQEK